MVDSADGGRERVGIVLADDHAMVRRGLRMVLEAEEGLSVVAEAGDVEEALRGTRQQRPAVVLLDLRMPGPPTLPAIERFREVAPSTAVVVLTMESDVAVAQAALAAGAQGYVLKEGAESELVNAVRAAASGRRYLDPSLGVRLASSSRDDDAPIAVGSTFAGHRIGCVLVHALFGHTPFERGTDLDTLSAHVHAPPPRLPVPPQGVPPSLSAVLAKALARDPEDRQQSAGAFAGEALAALEG